MQAFRQDQAIDAILEFVVEDVSRYYVQLVRERMWEEDDSESKRAAYATLYRVLRETVALLAPFAPFIVEEIYGTLTGDAEHDTVHMCDWPTADEDLRDAALESHIEIVREIEKSGSAARQQADRKLRWPVQRIVVKAHQPRVAEAVEAQRGLLKERLNAREIVLLGPEETWDEVRFAAEADMSMLGPAFGDDAGRVMNAFNEATLEERSVEALKDALADEDWIDVDELTEDMVAGYDEELPESVESVDFILDSDSEEYDGEHGGRVYVDSTLNEEIKSEGYAREVIRRVQEMRKDLELDIEERIRLDLDVSDDEVAKLARKHEDLIAEEVRADEFGTVEGGHRKTWEVKDVEMDIAIESVAAAEASD
jgi:isoleucyl-tRNA synthetase